MRRRCHYTAPRLVQALDAVGVTPGRSVYAHFDLAALGIPEEVLLGVDLFTVVHKAMRDAIGERDTLVTPAFSYSFVKQEAYDPATTPCRVGAFGERFRQCAGVVRSMDPIFSSAAAGPRAAGLFANLPRDCFGDGSLFRRLEEEDAIILLAGARFQHITALHAVEQEMAVPYRYRKLFCGEVRHPEGCRREAWIYNARLMDDRCLHDFSRLEKICRDRGLLAEQQVGLGMVAAVSLRDLFQTARQEFGGDPWFLARGPADDPIEIERQRLPPRVFSTMLSHNASMREIVETLQPLPRDLVSDGMDAATDCLKKITPMTVHQYPSGTPCFTWTVPERWACHRAALMDENGKEIFATNDHPLHVLSYSLPFSGVVGREELFRHLHSYPDRPDRIPFIFKPYERDWGLCCQDAVKRTLTNDTYRVKIDTETSCWTMKVGEIFLPGDREETFLFAAHLCHPYAANDDLSGVAVLIDLARELARRPRRRFSYRFLVGPETIGSAAWLSHNRTVWPTIKSGLFLEMLGSACPHSFQLSAAGNSVLDTLGNMMVEKETGAWIAPYLMVIKNDERMFNGPGIGIPMASLSRRQKNGLPFPEYHTDADLPDAIHWDNLEASRDLVGRIVDELETGDLPVACFEGELFCAGVPGFDYGQFGYPLAHGSPFLDGLHTVRMLARRGDAGFPFDTIRDALQYLHQQGFIRFLDKGRLA